MLPMGPGGIIMMLEKTNGLRTQRPKIANYVPCTDEVGRAIETWMQGVSSNSVSRFLLISGQSGLGKTTLGLCLADALGVQSRDVHQINCADLRTLEDARNLINTHLTYGPTASPYRIVILDECHQLVENAQQAFLTPFETLAPNIIVIGCTSNPEMLKPQLRGRAYSINLTPYPDERIVEILSNLPGEYAPELLVQVAQASLGVPRTAIGMLESGTTLQSAQQIQARDATFSSTMRALALAQPLCVQLSEAVEYNQVATFVRATSQIVRLAWYEKHGLNPTLPVAFREIIQTLAKRTGLPELYSALQYCINRHPDHLQSPLMQFVEKNRNLSSANEAELRG